MNKKEIRDKLKHCFEKCATGRTHLRKCVMDIMDAGFTRQDVLDVADEMATGKLKDEVYLCAVTAIGQALRYEENHQKNAADNNSEETKKRPVKKMFSKMWCC